MHRTEVAHLIEHGAEWLRQQRTLVQHLELARAPKVQGGSTLLNAEVHSISIAERRSGRHRLANVGIVDLPEVAQLADDNATFPHCLDLTGRELPLAPAAATEVPTGRDYSISGRFHDRQERGSRPGTVLFEDFDINDFVGKSAVHKHGLSVEAADGLPSVRHVVNADRGQGNTSSRISTSEPCSHDK
jgi:hypothetical protein